MPELRLLIFQALLRSSRLLLAFTSPIKCRLCAYVRYRIPSRSLELFRFHKFVCIEDNISEMELKNFSKAINNRIIYIWCLDKLFQIDPTFLSPCIRELRCVQSSLSPSRPFRALCHWMPAFTCWILLFQEFMADLEVQFQKIRQSFGWNYLIRYFLFQIFSCRT